MNKPYSPSCDRNKDPILEVLKKLIDKNSKLSLLEVGAGTAQHAIHMAPHFPNLIWQVSDVKNNLEDILEWVDEYKIPNIKTPIEYEVGAGQFPDAEVDIVFSANTLHIMAWEFVKKLAIEMQPLKKGTQAIFYGPFNYNGEYTSKSNADFDIWLKNRDPKSAIRDFEQIDSLMQNNGFLLLDDIEMPANNRILVFKKV